MIVLIEEAVFTSRRTERLTLLAVFQMGLVGRHRIHLDPAFETAEDGPFGRWLKGLDPATQEEIRFALAVGLEQGAIGPPLDLQVTIVDEPAADWGASPLRLPLQVAHDFLRQPLRILVENSRNDGAFLCAVAPTLWRDFLDKCLHSDWARFDHGGGLSEMEKQVEALRDRPAERLRTWALFDSDAREPGKPSDKSARLCSTCEQVGVTCHQLARRESENYLPVKALSCWVELSSPNTKARRRRSFSAFAGLGAQQRHHYNMCKGFEGDRGKERPKLPALFVDVEGKPDLQTGFGNNIGDLFYQRDFEFQEAWLLKDGQQRETSTMVQALLRLL